MNVTEPLTANDSEQTRKGLSMWMTSFFIVGQMTGMGLLVLPKALADTGWSGVFFLLFICINALYSSICLGRCWNILEERYEEYREKNRYPYPAIAYRSYGLKMRYLVSVCLEIAFLGTSIVHLLLAAQLIEKLANDWGISFCNWILIVTLILCPLMWLGTPVDIWPVAVIAAASVVMSIILLLISVANHKASTNLNPSYSSPTFLSYFLAFGTFYFTFGGGSNFPTYQNDMEDKTKFTKTITLSFGVILILHLPLAVLSYSAYGDSVHTDLTNSLPPSSVKTVVYVLFCLRTISGFLLVINASCQEFEDLCRVPVNFGWKRVVVRGAVLLFVLFLSLSVPRFGKILNLVGGSAITLNSLVFPCLFYFKLCSQRNDEWTERIIPTYEKFYLIIIILTGAIGCCITTYSSFLDIVKPGAFNSPCYINASTTRT